MEIIKINFLLIFFLTTYFLIFFFKKYNILIDNSYYSHKNFINNKTKPPAAGGIIILLSVLLVNQSYILKLILFFIFLLGLFSDLLIIKKTSYRIILQSILIVLYIIISNTFVQKTNFQFIDNLFNNKIFSISFTFFCLLVLMNGSNFVDGVNNLLSGYYLIIISLIIYIFFQSSIKIELYYYFYLFLSLFTFYIFNMFNKIYLGDSGSYLLSFIMGTLLIELSNNNKETISPLFIALLLWYPIFENLFSIIRKFLQNKKIYRPDNQHLHHIIYIFFKKNLKKKNLKYASSLSGNIINFYSFLVFLVGVNFINSNKYIFILILMNIFFYIFTYCIIKKYLKII